MSISQKELEEFLFTKTECSVSTAADLSKFILDNFVLEPRIKIYKLQVDDQFERDDKKFVVTGVHGGWIYFREPGPPPTPGQSGIKAWFNTQNIRNVRRPNWQWLEPEDDSDA